MKELIDDILDLPNKFYGSGNNKSIYELLSETGYNDNYDFIGENDIAKILSNRENYVNDWLSWSENKRSNGWYFIALRNGNFEVGHLENRKESKKFKDKIMACSYFIKNEIEDIRQGI